MLRFNRSARYMSNRLLELGGEVFMYAAILKSQLQLVLANWMSSEFSVSVTLFAVLRTSKRMLKLNLATHSLLLTDNNFMV